MTQANEAQNEGQGQHKLVFRRKAPHSARKDKKSTSSAPRVSSARLSSRRSWVGSEEALDTAQCASSLITKPITIKATPSSKPTKFRDPVGAQQVAFASHTTPISETEGEPSEDNIEDQQRKSRIHLWYQRLLHFRANPNSLEFSYLVLADPAATKYYPYDLIIVKHDQLVARDTSFFYTMSADGVTQTHGKEVTHMSLDEFERGYFLYKLVAQMHVFSQYRIWKAFRTWKRHLQRRKCTTVSCNLQDRLFILDGDYCGSVLLAVADRCEQLCCSLSLQALVPQQIGTLEDLKVDVQTRADQARQDVCRFSEHIATLLVEASKARISHLDAHLVGVRDGVVSDEAAMKRCKVPRSRREIQAKYPVDPQKAKPLFGATAPRVFGKRMQHYKGPDDQDTLFDSDGITGELSYALAATRRTEFRRISRLVKLCEYMVANMLHRVTMQGADASIGAVSAPAELAVPAGSPGKDVSVKSTSKPPQVQTEASTATAFLVSLQFRHTEDDVAIELEPSPDAILAAVSDAFERGVTYKVSAPAAIAHTVQLAAALLHTYPKRTSTLDRVMLDVAVSSATPLTCVSSLARFVYIDASSSAPASNAAVETSPHLHTLSDPAFSASANAALEQLSLAIQSACALRDSMSSLRHMLQRLSQIHKEEIEQSYAQGDTGIDELKSLLHELASCRYEVSNILLTSFHGPITVSAQELAAVLEPEVDRCESELHELLPELLQQRSDAFLRRLSDAHSGLELTSSSPEELERHLLYVNSFDVHRRVLDRELDDVEAHYDLCNEFKIEVCAEEDVRRNTLLEEYQACLDAQSAAESAREQRCESFLQPLMAAAAAVRRRVLDVQLVVQHEMLLNPSTDVEEAKAFCATLDVQLEELSDEADSIVRHQKLFGHCCADFMELRDAKTEIEAKSLVWNARGDAASLVELWEHSLLSQIDTDSLDDAIDDISSACMRGVQALPKNAVSTSVREEVRLLAATIHTAKGLKSDDLCDRHWGRIRALVPKLPPNCSSDSLSFGDLRKLGVIDSQDRVLEVVEDAGCEARLADGLKALITSFKASELSVAKHGSRKDSFILVGTAPLISGLEDAQLSLSSIASSRHVEPIRSEVSTVMEKFHCFGESLNELMELQRTWMRLDPVFSSSDFQRALPKESGTFSDVSKFFTTTMLKIRENPNAMQALANPSVGASFRQANMTLEVVQAQLTGYLSSKRAAWPRFQFISDAELVDILSNTRDARAIQKHIPQLFEGAARVKLEGTGTSVDVTALVSAAGEELQLARALKARGMPEGWLSMLEAAMRTHLRNAAKQGFKSALSMSSPADHCEWTLQNLNQIALLSVNLQWTANVRRALSASDSAPAKSEPQPTHSPSVSARLGVVLDESVSFIQLLSQRMSQKISSLHRQALMSVMITVVHHRDVVARLISSHVTSALDFVWQSQLRYTVPPDGSGVCVKQASSTFDYGWEYLGIQPRIVITPITDLCFLTLTAALNLCLGGNLEGPAGTGKTETVKELGKAMGMQTIVFNCGDSLDHTFMASFLSGVAQCGAFCCFDEFNRISVEVLSVVAQQLASIQAALRAHLATVWLSAREVPLSPCGVFVTMNPGYAGRIGLPDNLQALFRPMTLMAPDSTSVAEVVLFCEGFQTAPTLARKVVHVFWAAEQLLSQQANYDFGMRALKSTLLAAGAALRNCTSAATHQDTACSDLHAPQMQTAAQELSSFVHTLHEMLLPKLTSADSLVVKGLIQDTFTCAIPPPDQGADLLESINAATTALGLTPSPAHISKCLQLQKALATRFGVILLGFAASGKTSLTVSLQNALNRLASTHGPAGTDYVSITRHVINPKAYTLEDLYGMYQEVTGEWHEGLLPAACRQAMSSGKLGKPRVTDGQDSSAGHKTWLVLDGPVDSQWVENLNTVLDDSRRLCLASGERMSLSEQCMNVMLEVDDLTAASPATVSRCGMVYVPRDLVPWQVLVDAWFAELPSVLTGTFYARDRGSTSSFATRNADGLAGHGENTEEAGQVLGEEDFKDMMDQLRDLFDRHMDTSLQWLAQKAHEPVPTTVQQRVNAVCTWLQVILHPACGWDYSEGHGSAEQIALCNVFGFAIVWGLGGALQGDSRTAWDTQIRGQFNGEASFPSGAGLVFDYCLNPAHNYSFQEWEKVVPAATVNSSVHMKSLYCPTAETTALSWLLHSSVTQKKAALVVGPAGCGKTVAIRGLLQALSASDPNSAVEESANYWELKLPQPSCQMHHVEMCLGSQTSVDTMQRRVRGWFSQRKVGGACLPAGEGSLVAFVDDISMTVAETSRAQPALEVLRQIQDQGGWYDVNSTSWEGLQDAVMLFSTRPPGAAISQRCTRHMTTIYMPMPSEACMRQMFHPIVDNFFTQQFPAELRKVSRAVVVAAVEVHGRVAESMLPTPTTPQYRYNLHTLATALQGVLRIRASDCGTDSVSTVIKLWIHEHSLVYHSRCSRLEDASFIKVLLHCISQRKLGSQEAAEDVLGSTHEPLVFSEFVTLATSGVKAASSHRKGSKPYELVSNFSKLESAVRAAAFSVSPSFVAFPSAVLHISRTAACMRDPRGHNLMLGPSGTGRRTAVLVASAALSLRVFEPPPPAHAVHGRGRLAAFLDAFKSVLLAAGVAGEGTCMVITDGHLADPEVMTWISSILKADLNLENPFTAEEWEQHLPQLKPWCETHGVSDSPDAVYKAFLERLYNNTHVAIISNPDSAELQQAIRLFPAVLDCCTVHMHDDWPQEALLAVAKKAMCGVEQVKPTCRATFAEAAVAIHAAAVRITKAPPVLHLRCLQVLAHRCSEHCEKLQATKLHTTRGIAALESAEDAVADMRAELVRLAPLLATRKEAAAELQAQATHDAAAADAACTAVAAEEAEVARGAQETAALRDEARAAVAEVEPVIAAAEEALGALNRNDIVEIKTFTRPPALVQRTMEAVCILLSEQSDWDGAKRVLSDANFQKRLLEFERDSVTSQMIAQLEPIVSQPSFAPDPVGRQSKAAMGMCMWVHAIATYARASELAAPLHARLQAAQESLDMANCHLAMKQSELQGLKGEADAVLERLEAVNGEVYDLQEQTDISTRRLRSAELLTSSLGDERVRWAASAVTLEAAIAAAPATALLDAAALTHLGPLPHPHRTRLVAEWKRALVEYGVDGAAEIEQWTVTSSLGDDMEVRKWCLQGLPSDDMSVTSAVLTVHSQQVPLCIDPHRQAESWLRFKLGSGLCVVSATETSMLRVVQQCVKGGTPCLVTSVPHRLDPAITPFLSHTTSTAGAGILRQQHSDLSLTEKSRNLHAPGFKLYLTTQLAEPRFAAYTALSVSVINFSASQAVWEQLLVDCIRHEKPSLEASADALANKLAADTRVLRTHEEHALRLLQVLFCIKHFLHVYVAKIEVASCLQSCTGNILDDEELIQALDHSKQASITVQARLEATAVSSADIQRARSAYTSVPNRAAAVFYAAQAMSAVDPIYQLSLECFRNLLLKSMQSSAKSDIPEERLNNINSTFTNTAFTNISRGLFHQHRLPFAFLLAASISASDSSNFDTLLRMAKAINSNTLCSEISVASGVSQSSQSLSRSNSAAGTTRARQCPAGISQSCWDAVCKLAADIPVFEKLPDAIESNVHAWIAYALDDDSRRSPPMWLRPTPHVPSSSEQTGGHVPTKQLSLSNRALIALCWKPESLKAIMFDLVSERLGSKLLLAPSSGSLSAVLHDTSPTAPTILLVSPGTDPMSELHQLAHRQSPSKSAEAASDHTTTDETPTSIAPDTTQHPSEAAKSGVQLLAVSLGRSQWRAAEAAVEKGITSGYWVCLQNCHLAESDLLALTTLVQNLNHRENVHPDFRLWLTSAASPIIPTAIVAAGHTVVLEPPRGFRARLIHALHIVPDDMLQPLVMEESATHNPLRQKLWLQTVIAVAMYHAAVCERQRYGVRAWTSECQFTTGDMLASLCALRDLLVAHISQQCTTYSACTNAQRGQLRRNAILEAARSLLGDVHYGGRVKAESDRQVLVSMLCCTVLPVVRLLLQEDGHKTYGGCAVEATFEHHVPATLALQCNVDGCQSIQQVLGAVNSMPGLDSELDILCIDVKTSQACQAQETADCLQDTHTASMWLRANASASESAENDSSFKTSANDTTELIEQCKNILAMLPDDLSSITQQKDLTTPGKSELPSINTVLQSELASYCQLIEQIRQSLNQLQLALVGTLEMSPALQQLVVDLSKQQVPTTWASPQSATLIPWVTGLQRRLQHIKRWALRGLPRCVWLPSLFSPASFLVALLYESAQKQQLPAEQLILRIEATELRNLDDVKQDAKEGWYCSGIHLQGASWDHASGSVVHPEAGEKELSPLPVLLIKAVPRSQTAAETSRASEHNTLVRRTQSCINHSIDIFATLQRTTALAKVDLLVQDDSMNQEPGSCGPSHRWMLKRVAAFCVDSEAV